MLRFSYATTGILLTSLLSACGGDSSTSSTQSLLPLSEENQYAAASAAFMTPMEVLSASGDFIKLPQNQSTASAKARKAMSAIKSSKQAKAASTASAEIVREVEACGTSGETVIETEGDVITLWFNACQETATMENGSTFKTEQSGWVRYTILDSTEFDEAYVIEEDSTFKVKGLLNSDTDYSEHLQARMKYFQQDERLRLENVDYTLTDKGIYQGQSYNYTKAAQQLAFTSDPKAGATFSGRVGGWGTYYTGEAMINGLLEVASVTPLFFDQDDFPNFGSVAVKGGNSTDALVEISSAGYKLKLNGKPSLNIRW